MSRSAQAKQHRDGHHARADRAPSPSRSAPHRAPACPHRSRAHPSCRWRGDDPHDPPEASGKALGADQRPSSRSVLRSQPPRAPRLFGATISPRASPFACPDHASKSMEYRVGTNGSLTRTRSPSGQAFPARVTNSCRSGCPRSTGARRPTIIVQRLAHRLERADRGREELPQRLRRLTALRRFALEERELECVAEFLGHVLPAPPVQWHPSARRRRRPEAPRVIPIRPPGRQTRVSSRATALLTVGDCHTDVASSR